MQQKVVILCNLTALNACWCYWLLLPVCDKPFLYVNSQWCLYTVYLPIPSALPLFTCLHLLTAHSGSHFQAHTVATSFPQWWSVPPTQYLSPSSLTVVSQIEDSPPSGRLCILRILEVPRTQHTQRQTEIHSHLRHTLQPLHISLQNRHSSLLCHILYYK